MQSEILSTIRHLPVLSSHIGQIKPFLVEVNLLISHTPQCLRDRRYQSLIIPDQSPCPDTIEIRSMLYSASFELMVKTRIQAIALS
jgi:hypothetical protein